MTIHSNHRPFIAEPTQDLGETQQYWHSTYQGTAATPVTLDPLDAEYPTYDALLYSFLERHWRNGTFTRVSLTSGSAEYQLLLNTEELIGAIRLQSLPNGRTLVQLYPQGRDSHILVLEAFNYATAAIYNSLSPLPPNILENLCNRFNERYNQIHGGNLLPADTQLVPPRQGYRSKQGRKSWDEDDWAWKQVNLYGQSPESVRVEWKRRSAHRGLRDPSGSFRYAIKPDRKK